MLSSVGQYTRIARRAAQIMTDTFISVSKLIHYFTTSNKYIAFNLLFCCTVCRCKVK